MGSDDISEEARPPVSVAAFAAKMGFSPNGFKRALLSRGIVPFQLKNASNAPYFVSASDAEAFERAVDDERRLIARPSEQALPQRLGGVYCVEVPSYDGQIRVKIGWAESFDDRLSTYRTIVPDLHILGLWPTRDQWMERAALRFAENTGRRVFTELFEFDDNPTAVAKLDRLFSEFGVKSIIEQPREAGANEHPPLILQKADEA